MKTETKKLLNRCISSLLAVAILMGGGLAAALGFVGEGINSLAANAADVTVVKKGSCGENVTYTLDNKGTLTISGKGDMYNYNRNDSPFYSEEDINKVIIEDGVTSIGEFAFECCTSLTTITIPNSVTSIGNAAFMDCDSLTSITIPNSVTSIGEYAFEDCFSLKSIKIPNSVTSIGDSAFEYCDSLTSITIPNSVTSIGAYAFNYCDNLMSITIPNSVTSIGDSAFKCCASLTSITIPNSVTSIGEYAFGCCASLTSITIPSSVTSIGAYAFYDCESLTNITIPNSVTSIGYDAFDGCYSLTSITIPNSVTSIGEWAFWACDSLTDVYYSGTKEEWEDIDIDSGNGCLTGANIHYNSGITYSDSLSTKACVILSDEYEYSLSNWCSAEIIYKTNKSNLTKNEVDSFVDSIKWTVSDPSVVAVEGISSSYNKNINGTSISIYLNLKALSLGKTIITGTLPDGKTATVECYSEPMVNLTKNSSGTKFTCSAKIYSDNKDYLNDFMKNLTVDGKGIKTGEYKILVSKSGSGWSADFDIPVNGMGSVECSVVSPGGQYCVEKMYVDDDGYYKPVYDMKTGQLSSGILENADDSVGTVVIGGKTYSADSGAISSAKEILANSKITDKTVITCSQNNVIKYIDSVYSVYGFDIYTETEPFVYSGGKLNRTSSEMKVDIHCTNIDPTYDYNALKNLDVTFSVSKIVLESQNSKINFGKSFLLNKTSQTEKFDEPLVFKIGETKSFNYNISIDENYVPRTWLPELLLTPI